LGESNLERNSIAIFRTCIEADGDVRKCKDVAVDYAEDKADAIQDFFENQLEESETWPAELKQRQAGKRVEWIYRKNKAIPDALKRTKRKLDEIEELVR